MRREKFDTGWAATPTLTIPEGDYAAKLALTLRSIAATTHDQEEVSMLRKSLSLVLLMLFIGTLVSLGAQELAQGAASPLTTAGNDIALGPHTLYATYAKYSNTPVIVGAGYQPVDNGTMFTCPGSSCLVEFDEFVQISSPKPGDGTWSICAAVDGNLVNTPNCPSQGQPNVYGTYTVGSFIQFATVSSGMHTLQTFVYSPDGLTKDIWSLAYRVYYP